MPSELSAQVHLILSQSRGRPAYRDLAAPPLTVSAGNDLTPYQRALMNQLAVNTATDICGPGTHVLDSEPMVLLRRLYATADDEGQLEILKCLAGTEASNAVPTATHFCLEYHATPLLGTLHRAGLKSPFARDQVLTAIGDKITYEGHLFTNEALVEIEQEVALMGDAEAPLAPDELKKAKARVFARINRLRYLRLRAELLEGSNPEINADQMVVINRAAALGFRPEIRKALEEIDRKLVLASTPFDFKGCMDLVRTAFEEFVEDSAKAIEPKSANTIPVGRGTSHFGTFLDFVRDSRVIGQDEHKAIQPFYNFLSNVGAHRLGVAPEHARVARNLAIEWMLFLSGRVSAFLE